MRMRSDAGDDGYATVIFKSVMILMMPIHESNSNRK